MIEKQTEKVDELHKTVSNIKEGTNSNKKLNNFFNF
jgi:hypothetical protein